MNKEQYLRVNVEEFENSNSVKVYYRGEECFCCDNDDGQLFDIEEIQEDGANRLLDALRRLVFYIGSNKKDKVENLFGYRNIDMILNQFDSNKIIELVEKLDDHTPEPGDIYICIDSVDGHKVAVLSYDREFDKVQYIDRVYMHFERKEYFQKRYEFTGKNCHLIENIMEERNSEDD